MFRSRSCLFLCLLVLLLSFSDDCRAGGQVPGDCTQDGVLDLGDAVCLLGHLFLGTPERLPCGDGSARDAANVGALDANGDRSLGISDPVHILTYLFSGGPPHATGTRCVSIDGCMAVCEVSPPPASDTPVEKYDDTRSGTERHIEWEFPHGTVSLTYEELDGLAPGGV